MSESRQKITTIIDNSNENYVKHLEIIQDTIQRMANKSFLLKGWAITLYSALFALSSNESNPNFYAITYFPLIMFFLLDGYYLYQERLFRKLYDAVRTGNPKIDVFCMNTTLANKSDKIVTYWSGLLSITVIGFYGPLLLINALLALIIF